MTIQVSKEAYGPQVCSPLSQITYRNIVRGKNEKSLRLIFSFVFFRISFVYFRCIVLCPLNMHENVILVKVFLFSSLKLETFEIITCLQPLLLSLTLTATPSPSLDQQFCRKDQSTNPPTDMMTYRSSLPEPNFFWIKQHFRRALNKIMNFIIFFNL